MLFNQNEILKAILDNNNDLILFALDKEYRYIFFTQAHKDTMKMIWGKDIDINVNILDVIQNNDDKEKAKRNFASALSGESFTIIEEYGNEHLTRTFYKDFYSPIIINNEIIGLYVFVIDITDVKKAEKDIIKNKHFYHTILDNISNPIFYKNIDGSYEFVNKAFTENLNLSLDNVLGKKIEEILPNQGDFFKNKDKELLEKKSKQVYEFEIETPNGLKNFIINKTLLLENDIPIGITGSLTDITYLKNIEAKLTQEEKYLTNLFNILPIGIFLLDYSYNIIMTNKISTKIIDQINLENHHRITNFSQIKFIDQDRTIIDFIDYINKTQSNIIENLILGIFFNGHIHWYSINILKDETQILLTLNDITELHNTRELLEKNIEKLNWQNKKIQDHIAEQDKLLEELLSNKHKLEDIINEKNKLLSIIAHDLKSPLSGIIGIASILVNDFKELPTEKIFNYIQKIYNSNKNLLRLINNLMDWVNIKSDNISINKEIITLKSFLNEVKVNISNNLTLKDITLQINLEDDIKVLADKVMLNSILTNLIYNAIKFSYRGNKIDLNITKDIDNFATFEVKDYGIGIPEIMLDKIFDITEKTGRPGTEDEKSTGLGLIIVKEFIEKNGGKIWIKSQENVGTSVFFTIPLAN